MDGAERGISKGKQSVVLRTACQAPKSTVSEEGGGCIQAE